MTARALLLGLLLGPWVGAAPLPKSVKASPFYFPVVAGAKWVYETAGGELESAIVDGVEKDGDALIVTREGVDGTRVRYSRMIVTAEGLRQEREPAGGKLAWVLRTNLRSGQSWDVPEEGPRTVFGPETVRVPAGTYRALRVEWTQADRTYVSWYAPGVGEVKRIWKRGGTETVFRVLRSFRPNADKK